MLWVDISFEGPVSHFESKSCLYFSSKTEFEREVEMFTFFQENFSSIWRASGSILRLLFQFVLLIGRVSREIQNNPTIRKTQIGIVTRYHCALVPLHFAGKIYSGIAKCRHFG